MISQNVFGPDEEAGFYIGFICDPRTRLSQLIVFHFVDSSFFALLISGNYSLFQIFLSPVIISTIPLLME